MMMLHCDIFKMFKKVRLDILALQEKTPADVEHPLGKVSDGTDSNGERSAAEAKGDLGSQVELRARVETSMQRAESTLAEVKRRVQSELEALDEKIAGGRPQKSGTARTAPGLATQSTTRTTSKSNSAPEDDEAAKREVDDLIRGSKTLDDLLRDVEMDLEQTSLAERPPAA